MTDNDPLQDAIRRQTALFAAHQNRIPQPPIWTPSLPEAEGDYLGLLCGENSAETYSWCPIALFPNERILATGHGDGRVRCWDLSTGNLLWQSEREHLEALFEVAVSGDGRLVASGGRGGRLRLWDATTGQCLARCEGHRHDIYRLCWSPRGDRLASVQNANTQQFRIWDAVSGACLHVCEGLTTATQVLAWSVEGLLALGDNNGHLLLWEGETITLLQRFQPYANTIWSLRFSRDGARLAVGYYDGTILLLDPHTGLVQQRWQGHTSGVSGLVWSSGVSGLAWSPEGDLLATGGFDYKLRVWDVPSGQLRKEFACPEQHCYRLEWSFGGGFLVSGHSLDLCCFWDVRSLLPNFSGSETESHS